jgi:hypothetical protein
MRRLSLVATVAGLVVALIAGPALAQKWDEKFIDEFDFVVPSADLGCDFDLRVEGSDKIQVRVNDLTVIVSHNSKATLTNLANGQSVDDPGTWKDTLTFDEDGNLLTIDTTGSIFRVTVPGEGIVVQDTGKIVFNPETGEVLFEAGPHEAFHGEGADLCAGLGGNPLP